MQGLRCVTGAVAGLTLRPSLAAWVICVTSRGIQLEQYVLWQSDTDRRLSVLSTTMLVRRQRLCRSWMALRSETSSSRSGARQTRKAIHSSADPSLRPRCPSLSPLANTPLRPPRTKISSLTRLSWTRRINALRHLGRLPAPLAPLRDSRAASATASTRRRLSPLARLFDRPFPEPTLCQRVPQTGLGSLATARMMSLVFKARPRLLVGQILFCSRACLTRWA